MVFAAPTTAVARQAKAGYGVAMLAIFLTTTVMIGSSMQLLVAPVVSTTLGAASQDNTAAQELAYSGMETVLADIQSKWNSGQSLTTGYTFSSTGGHSSVIIPQSPDALTGSTSTVGSYIGKILYIQRNSLLVQVIATVGSGNYGYQKLITLNNNPFTLDNITSPSAAYGLRKLRAGYSGSAIRVRRSTDNTEQNIGFTSAGDLDVSALRAFLDGGTAFQAPLDRVGSAANAYGLRKLRQAYTGSAVRIRRSSDNTEQDIGFASNGNLDVNALLDFVGTGSGYVKTWYDQSGNGANATQANAGEQPTLVSSGQLQLVNGRPALRFDGTDDSLRFARSIGDDFSILACYSAIAGTGASDRYWFNHAGLVDMEVGGDTNDFGISVDSAGGIIAGVGMPDGYGALAPSPGYNDGLMHRVTFTRQKSTSAITLYVDGVSTPSNNGNVNTLNAASELSLGRLQTGWGPLNGYVSEVITYGSLLSNTNRQILERNQAGYHNIREQNPSSASETDYPLDIVGSAAAAYSVRKLRSTYAGSALQVRCTADGGTPHDIGFNAAGELDVTTLMGYAGSGSCYVKTWYDQSGNGRDATNANTAEQPRIVDNGGLDILNGKPTVRGLGGQVLFGPEASLGATFGWQVFLMTADYGSAANAYWIDRNCLTGGCPGGAGTAGAPLMDLRKVGTKAAIEKRFDDHTGYATIAGNTIIPTDGTPFVIDYQRAPSFNASDFKLYINGTLDGTGSDGGGTITPRGPALFGHVINTTARLNGAMSEVILYTYTPTDAQRIAIEQNLMQVYSAPLAEGYVTTWYDQSTNGKNLTQSDPANQPRIVLERNKPALAFNGNSTFLQNTAMSLTGTQATALAVGKLSAISTSFAAPRLLSGWANGQSSDGASATSASFFAKNGVNMQLLGGRNGASGGPTLSGYDQNFQAWIKFDGTNATQSLNGVSGGGFASTGSFSINNIRVGSSTAGNYYEFWKGTISEVLLYPTALTAAQLELISTQQRNYYRTP